MKIGFITADWSDIVDPLTGIPTMGGSGYYRVGVPSFWLWMNGFDVAVGEKISTGPGGVWIHDWYGNVHEDCDVLVFQRWMSGRAPDVYRIAKQAGQKIVNEIDDWYWGLHPDNIAYKRTDPHLHPDENRDHYWKALGASDLITTSTPGLVDALRPLGVETALIRNAIDLCRWDISASNSPVTRIGWVGGTPWRSGDLETLRGVLGPFCERHSCRFVHGGYMPQAPSAGQLAGVPSALEDKYLMEPITTYPRLLANFDVGVVPLNDIRFNRMKSALKGMEMAAAGIPFVAQALDEYVWLKETHDIGLTAKKPTHWIAGLTKLLDPEFRADEAAKNLVNVKALDIESNWVSWAEAYTSLV